METLIKTNIIIPEDEIITNNNPFIIANTKAVSLDHLKNDCIIPVFSKDMECTLAHHQLVKAVEDCVKTLYAGHQISQPDQRVSHVVKGRKAEAIGKPVQDLLEKEKTLYYERFFFKIDIPSITESIGPNSLNLTVGAVRAYNQENLYSYKNYEKFKVFVGFRNNICSNLFISTDGVVLELRASSVDELKNKIMELIGGYEMQNHLNTLKQFTKHYLTEKQFANFLGKCRMYNHLPKKEKIEVPTLLLNDSQLNNIAKGYYEDEHFSRNEDGTISLYNLYNLCTESNKSSYIESFLPRAVNVYELINKLAFSMQSDQPIWHLN